MATRVLFPRTGFSTDDLVCTYEQLAPVLLPHVAERPLTLKRFPDDIHGEAFWEKDAPSFTPKWVRTLPVPRKHEPGVIRYIGIPDVKTLRWAASIGCIEIHAFLHRYPYITSPTLIAFDLDPGEGTGFADCSSVALLVRAWLRERALESWAKTSGSKGLQVYAPLNTPTTYAITHALARRLAEDLEREHPRRIISRMGRAGRAGKVFIDWSQNMEHKTTVAVYSVRAKQEEPFVSMPLRWEEVEEAAGSKSASGLLFSPQAAIQRVKEMGDLFAPVLTLEQTIGREVLRELRIGSAMPALEPVRVVPAPAPPRLPRSSGQGGRRLFVIHRLKAHFDLALELGEEFERLAMAAMPLSKNQKANAESRGVTSLGYLTEESTRAGVVWDLGTYEVVEGSYAKGYVLIYISGRKLQGEWSLRRMNDGRWECVNRGGRLIDSSDTSALAGLLPAVSAQKRTRRAS